MLLLEVVCRSPKSVGCPPPCIGSFAASCTEPVLELTELDLLFPKVDAEALRALRFHPRARAILLITPTISCRSSDPISGRGPGVDDGTFMSADSLRFGEATR